jgi:RNA polymerase sigma-32 factor
MSDDDRMDPLSFSAEGLPLLPEGASLASGSEALEVFDPLKKYLTEIRKFPLLSREEELALAKRWWHEKDRSAAYRMVVSNLRLVVKIAFDYQRAYSNLLDLIQEGNLGLMQAVKKFDPYRDVKLSSYASWWIRAYILKFIIENWSLVKIGTTQAQRKLFFRLKKEKGRLEALGFEAGPKLLASALDVRPETVSEMEQRLEGGDLSLNQPLEGDGRQSYLDVLPDADGLEERVTDSQFREVLSRKIAQFSQTLKGKEAFILQNRLLAEDPLTLQATGEELKISRERARQIEKNVMTKLKAYLKEELPEFDDLQFTPK